MIEWIAVVTKAVLYAAALSGAGSALARAALLPASAVDEPRIDQVISWAGSVLAFAAITTAVLFVVRLGNYWDLPTLSAIFVSPLGLALSLHIVCGLWLATGVSRAENAIAAALIILAFAISGHAGGSSWLLGAIMALHVGAAAWWIGGLWLLLRASKTQDASHFLNLVSRFSSQALWVVGTLVVAGFIAAAFLLEFQVDLSRGYDRGLTLKICLALTLLGVAVFNKFVLTPRLVRQSNASAGLRRSIIGELSLVACILASTATLTTFSSPHEVRSIEPERVAISGPIDIIEPWAAPTPGGVSTAAGYLSIVNNQSEEDHLISARSTRARIVTLHENVMDGQMVRMQSVATLSVQPGERLDLASGRYHLMFEDIDAPFLEGDVIPVALVFEKAGELELLLPVRRGAGHAH